MTSIGQQGLGSVPNYPFPNSHYNLTSKSFDLVSSPVWWEAETNNCPCFGGKADGINLLLALPTPCILAWLSGVYVWQTWSQKTPGFGWATFEWASCIIDTFL